PAGHEPVEALGQDVGRDTQPALEVGEPRRAGEDRVADDQQAPAFADQFQRPRRRAVLTVVGPTEHEIPLPLIKCKDSLAHRWPFGLAYLHHASRALEDTMDRPQ